MLNRERTQRRGARRGIQRYKLRRRRLTDKLTELGMMPDRSMLTTMSAEELYGLRNRALTHKISLQEIGRIFYHLNQKRGYKSNRKTALKENQQETEYTGDIIARTVQLEKQKLTIGRYFHRRLLADAKVHDPNFRIKKTLFLREAYIKEFDAIWDRQQKYHPSILTEGNRKEIRDNIIYYQRRLKSQKGLVGNCRYEIHHKVAPKSSPLFQVFNLWQKLNNLVIENRDHEHVPIERSMKLKLVLQLEECESMSKTDVLKALGLIPTKHYSVNFDRLDGNKTRARIIKVLREGGLPEKTIGSMVQFDPLSGQLDKEPLYGLWHLLYSSEEPAKLIEKLMEKYAISRLTAEGLSEIKFTSEYGSLSSRAIRKLLPAMYEGMLYHDACKAVGYRHTDTRTKEEDETRELQDRINPIARNELRNPMVEKIGNQVAGLVNDILASKSYGRPDEIRVELARELKSNAKERAQNLERNRELEKINTAARNKLIEMGILKPSRSDIQKYRLWEETGNRSVYTGEMISFSDLFHSGRFDVDHIIPRALLFDDSYQNKAVIERSVNADKGNQTAYDYMKRQSDEKLANYVSIVNELYEREMITRAKRNRMLMTRQDIPEDFIERQLRETQYIAKEMHNRLQSVCRRVTTTTGSITSVLRNEWGLEDMMRQINIDSYRKQGRVVKEIDRATGKQREMILDWSKRDDHRNHAVDAIVIACTKPGMIRKLNTLNSTGSERDLPGTKAKQKDSWHIPVPWKGFRLQAEFAVRSILVSFSNRKRSVTWNKNLIRVQGEKRIAQLKKMGKEIIAKNGAHFLVQRTPTPRGSLHKETVYGQILQYKRVPLNKNFSAEQYVNLVHPHEARLVERHLTKYGNNIEDAMKAISKDPIYTDDTKTGRLDSVTVFQKSYVYRVPVQSLADKSKGNIDKVLSEVVDGHVRKMLRKHLEKFGFNAKLAFKDLENNPVWFDEERKIPIHTVRMIAHADDLVPLHHNDAGSPTDFVFTRNNHHSVIFKDQNGIVYERLVSFWEAVERARSGMPVIDRNPPPGHSFLYSMRINDMFVIGLDANGMDIFDAGNRQLVSRYLYRLQKISSCDYCFRHHIESKLDNEHALVRFQSLSALEKLFKVNINRLGEIVRVGE
jgi:CRISPR-associated endonuclease Csn1